MRTLSRVCVALLTLALASCDPPPAEEGFELRMNFESVDASVVDSLRITFMPDSANLQRFMSVEPMSFEMGRVSYTVDANGNVIMIVSGSLVQERAVDNGDGSFTFSLDLFTEDTQMRSPTPQISVVAFRETEAIADGRKFLPEWPLPLGGFDVLRVPCLPSAATAGRCRP